jgi:hypothetical protein
VKSGIFLCGEILPEEKSAYVIFAKNGEGGMIYANIDRFPIDGDTAVMIP